MKLEFEFFLISLNVKSKKEIYVLFKNILLMKQVKECISRKKKILKSTGKTSILFKVSSLTPLT